MPRPTTSHPEAGVGNGHAVVQTSATPRATRFERLIRRHYPETDFGGFSTVSGTVAFYVRLNAMLTPESRVLDVGCGRGAWREAEGSFGRDLRCFRGRCREVVGIDVDEAGKENESLDRFGQIEGGRWPVEDASIDLAICDYVVEHLTDVEGFFSELQRVLAPGGVAAIRTPNKWFYVSVFSRLIPNRLHSKVVGRVQDGRHEQDVFDTVYRCNTGRALRSAFARHGLEGVVTYHEAEPLYLTFHPLAFRLGVLHQRFAPKYFRANLFAFARKAR